MGKYENAKFLLKRKARKELTGDFGNFYFAIFGKNSTGVDMGRIESNVYILSIRV
jgi:hypothetical protein